MPDVPPADNLNICRDHRLAMHSAEEDHGRCPACLLAEQEIDVEVRPEAETPGRDVNQQEVRQRLDAETVADVVPVMLEYLDDVGEGPLYLTVERFEGDLPAGYSEAQERWVNAIVYEFGSRKKALTTDGEAAATRETLRDEGYGR